MVDENDTQKVDVPRLRRKDAALIARALFDTHPYYAQHDALRRMFLALAAGDVEGARRIYDVRTEGA